MCAECAEKHAISIHAPTRGATVYTNMKTNILLKFQSTLPRGERQRERLNTDEVNQFQSTLPRGERHRGGCRGRGYIGFQSTLPRGERRFTVHLYTLTVTISIHAPTRGATMLSVFRSKAFGISIHAPTRGATAIFAKKFSFLSAKIV